jgi:hypothetical protein
MSRREPERTAASYDRHLTRSSPSYSLKGHRLPDGIAVSELPLFQALLAGGAFSFASSQKYRGARA